jgi:VanZ family protein
MLSIISVNRRKIFAIIDFSLLFLYCSFIYWLSDQSALPTRYWFAHQDKVMHAGAYFIMAVLTWRSFIHYLKQPYALAIISLVFCSLYGGLDEWHQSFIPGRTPDMGDWIADTIGAAIAIGLLTRLSRRKSGNNLRP